MQVESTQALGRWFDAGKGRFLNAADGGRCVVADDDLGRCDDAAVAVCGNGSKKQRRFVGAGDDAVDASAGVEGTYAGAEVDVGEPEA